MAAMIRIGSTDLPDPSVMGVTEQDISEPDAGRTMNGTMYKKMKGQIITIQLEWWQTDPATTAAILTAVHPEYFNVTFLHPRLNTTVTREFYVGDRTTNVQQWYDGGKLYKKVSFNLIQRTVTTA